MLRIMMIDRVSGSCSGSGRRRRGPPPPSGSCCWMESSGGPYHAWQETTPYLKRMLDDTGLFQVDVVTAPPRGGDFSKFQPEWGKYKVVVANYDVPDERWSDSLKASFEQYVRNGGGLVSVHASDNAFPNWKEYNLMIGVGGWRGRNEKSGPHFYYQDGKVVADPAPGSAGSHGARQAFKVVNQVANHPITKGLPKEWMHVADELYANMRGPGENMTVLSTAWSDPANRGTNHEEPILMVLSVRQGADFPHGVGARSGGAELRGLHRHLPARDGMGGYGQGDAEGSGRLSDGGEDEHARGVQSAGGVGLAGRRAAAWGAGEVSGRHYGV